MKKRDITSLISRLKGELKESIRIRDNYKMLASDMQNGINGKRGRIRTLENKLK